MAKIFPDIDDIGFVSSINRSEIEVYKILKNSSDTKNWIIFYSSRLKINPTINEIDFIILIPDEGVVLLELKANNPIKYNQYYFVYNYNGQNVTYENPFRKLKNLIPRFKTYLNLTEEEKNKIFVHYMLIFPNFNGDFDENICFSKSNYINSKFSDIPSAIIAKFNNAKMEFKHRIGASASKDEINSIIEKIKKELLKSTTSIETSSINFDDALKKSKDILINFYLLISNLKKVFISGPASSGKTFFALQKIIDKNSENTISYVCNSKLLFEKMRYSFHKVKNVDIARYNDLSNLKKQKYDILILDEFEMFDGDILVFDKILKGGFVDGSLMILFDPYKRNKNINDFLEKYKLNDFKIKLDSNFRNNSAISNFINKLYDTQIYRNSFMEYYSSITIKPFDDSNIGNLFENTISDLVEKDKYLYSDIKVITSKKPEESSISKVISKKKWSYKIDFVFLDDFDGLEGKVVVFIVEETSLPLENILYRGVTRASQKLIILSKNNLYERIKSYV